MSKEKKNVKPNTIETLQRQYKEYAEKAEMYKVLALKAQGAVEVLAQLEEEGESK